MSRLRVKLIVLIFVSSLPLFLLFLYTFFEQREQLSREARDHTLRLVRLVAVDQQRHIDAAHAVLNLLSQVPIVQRFDLEAANLLFANLLRNHESYANLGMIGMDGRVLASGLRFGEDVDLSDRLYFRRAVETKAFSVGEYQIGRITGRASINFGHPVMDARGNVKAVLFAALDLSWLNRLAEEIELPDQSALIVLDRSGTVLAAYPDSDDVVGKPFRYLADLAEVFNKPEGMVEVRNHDGVPQIIAFTALAGTPEAGFVHMSITMSQEYAFQEIRKSLLRNMAAVIFVTLLALVIAWFGSDVLVVRKVNTIIEASRKIAQGKLDTRIGWRERKGELARLGDAFDNMAVSLQHLMDERNNREAQLAQQAALLDVGPEAILVIDPEGYVAFWNKGAERLYGWTGQEVTGKKAVDLYAAGIIEGYEKALRAVLREGRWSAQWKHRRKDGTEVMIESSWTLVRDGSGNPKAIYSVNTDITEKKKIESRLMRSQRLESLGTLAGGIAHDLNNVLGPILLSVEVIRKDLRGTRSERILDVVESSVKRGSDLVKQILTFARGSEGERTTVQPRTLVQEIETIVRQVFPKSIRLEAVVADDVWPVTGDSTQLHQVFLNLCVNARDAMPEGGVIRVECRNRMIDAVFARTHPDAKPGAYVQIVVSDTGEGMTKEVLEKVFEPFFTTKKRGEGTGLGLATVAGIIKSHRGFVNMYSEVGKGTTFRIYLPAVPAEGGVIPVAAAKDLPVGAGEAILIIDDESSLGEIAKTTLESSGYRAMVAVDGAEGVAVFAKERGEIDVILCDMSMPVMDGPATVRALRRMKPGARIVMMSGLGEESLGGLGDEKLPFLRKPYTAEELLRSVARELEKAEAV